MSKKNSPKNMSVLIVASAIIFLLAINPNALSTFIILSVITLIMYFWFKFFNKRTILKIPYTLAQIDAMDPYDFEYFICQHYRQQGYTKAYTTPKSGDFGADIVIPSRQETIVVQVKKYNQNNPTGISSVQEVLGATKYYNAQKGIVITTSYFTKSAIILAKKADIELIDRSKLTYICSQRGEFFALFAMPNGHIIL